MCTWSICSRNFGAEWLRQESDVNERSVASVVTKVVHIVIVAVTRSINPVIVMVSRHGNRAALYRSRRSYSH